jgi:hypothetical protein
MHEKSEFAKIACFPRGPLKTGDPLVGIEIIKNI